MSLHPADHSYDPTESVAGGGPAPGPWRGDRCTCGARIHEVDTYHGWTHTDRRPGDPAPDHLAAPAR